MHIIHNLNYEKSIIDQLHDFAVAVNYMNPKPEDYHYKYANLTQEHKDCIWGMAIQIDNLANFEDNRKVDVGFGDNTPTITKIQDEFEEAVVNRAYEWLVIEMCETLIAFADDEYCEKEGMNG